MTWENVSDMTVKGKQDLSFIYSMINYIILKISKFQH